VGINLEVNQKIARHKMLHVFELPSLPRLNITTPVLIVETWQVNGVLDAQNISNYFFSCLQLPARTALTIACPLFRNMYMLHNHLLRATVT